MIDELTQELLDEFEVTPSQIISEVIAHRPNGWVIKTVTYYNEAKDFYHTAVYCREVDGFTGDECWLLVDQRPG